MDKICNGFETNYSDADQIIKKYVFKGKYITENVVELLHNECPV